MAIMSLRQISFGGKGAGPLKKGEILAFGIVEPKLGKISGLLETARGARNPRRKPDSLFEAAERLEGAARDLVDASRWDANEALRIGELKTPSEARATAIVFLDFCEAAGINGRLDALAAQADAKKEIRDLDCERQLLKCAGDIKAAAVNGKPDLEAISGFMEALRYFI